ncbi:hypothetical protein CTEN210_06237 [Chaetoceros tenuissimus]|uniref:F-box domain-containing protein n=1 Tax=Chaetoceros tenuissimus TaxID=426638 RepID=A0AAD3CRB8_9STRA|nr:hypothetical protein CTEN210_06237 [Chaetoceros tenuissimus]
MTDQSDVRGALIPSHLQDLPDEVFQHVLTYLTDTSKINLALSKLCSQLQALKILSKHIQDRKRLDTGNLYPEIWENEEPTELNDDDIATLLTMINAKNNLRVLILSQTNITGAGLEPLRNSKKLKRISFPEDCDETKLSEDAVIPILRSMLPPNVEKSSLLHVDFPSVWTGTKKKANFAEFLSIFDAELKRRKYCCKDCGKRCTPYHDCEESENESGSKDETDSVDDSDYNFICQDTGKARYVCEKCRSFCCHKDDEYACENARKECLQCSKLVCGGCRDECDYCEEENGECCQDCMGTCDNCQASFCPKCYHYCEMHYCEKILCNNCGDVCESCNDEARDRITNNQ